MLDSENNFSLKSEELNWKGFSAGTEKTKKDS
jgi:hypothetical protein